METDSFVFEEQDFQFEKGPDFWQLSLKRSKVGTQNLQQLQLLEIHHSLLMPMTTAIDADTIQFQFQTEAHALFFESFKKETLSEKLRLALNVLDLDKALSLSVNFILHPSNLFLTKNATAKIAYRSLPGIMRPEKFGPEEFLYQFKCFVFALLTQHDYIELYNGAISVIEVSDFLKSIYHAETIQAVRDIITIDYEQQVEVETHTLAKVSRAKYKLYKYISVWLGALSTILLIPLVYLVFIHNPFKEKMLAADTSFIKVDYNQVINRLEHVKVSKLPYTQKYELAYSYDAAKRLDDSDLVIYAIVQKMDQVRKDNSLSGKDREQKLSELQTDYDKYWKDRKTALTDEESKSKNSNNHSTNSNKESSESSSTTASTSSKTKSR
ncbi:TPA: type VII secretion protein EssB [Streptococcus agalactiae]|nr:type VII secretion protein EssB [Streptococcus agalactiae]